MLIPKNEDEIKLINVIFVLIEMRVLESEADFNIKTNFIKFFFSLISVFQ